MFSICQNYIKVNDDLFLIKRTFSEESVKNVELVKEWLEADAVYKKDAILYFCIKINEAEILN